MTELNQDPFDARWLNCLYGGKLAGRTKVVTDAFIFIEPLLEITLQDGSKLKPFWSIGFSHFFASYLVRKILVDYKNQHGLKAMQGKHHRLLRSYDFSLVSSL